jgi:RimJ/RimL family protein N-acetyltransferase
VELQGKLVRVREWRRSDNRLMEAWPPFSDPLDQIWNLPRSVSAGGESGFDDWGLDRRTWAIEDLSARLIGRISLREIDPRLGQARLGISMGAPYVGKGMGSEALRLFLGHYFGALGFAMMVLDVAAPNQRAVRCYRRLGFRTVGEDWRAVPASVDLRFLDNPEYTPLMSHFRFGRHGVWVQFFEMELPKTQHIAAAAGAR